MHCGHEIFATPSPSAGACFATGIEAIKVSRRWLDGLHVAHADAQSIFKTVIVTETSCLGEELPRSQLDFALFPEKFMAGPGTRHYWMASLVVCAYLASSLLRIGSRATLQLSDFCIRISRL